MTSSSFPILPLLNGLVLAGGNSTRMGTAKEKICWHGKEQQYAMADLLAQFCGEVFISCRPEQMEKIRTGYSVLPDAFTEMGPISGILSAFDLRKDTAWLVVACDMPLLDEKALGLLTRFRDPEKTATVYESPVDGKPEPLAAIWEPKSFPLLLDFIQTGSRSPRKFMMNSDIFLLKPEDPQVLRNVNTQEEAAEVRRMIENSR
ncbi:NTP transferase domain-containing protein [Chryseobacterium sp. SN22]|uniref:NTP transferase domain-containing protein n=1 Tax=Chryseobacterium sp. SN22 TaxID=2606431 RepID=UPI0011F07522|nr:NTP transferase domain-containing protein [Chryseobacterium sp. SN22]KAA0129371.1 NTP transferase domain-containing protein [Chryseobacterium sp. SN22]